MGYTPSQRSRLSQVQADAVSTAIEFEHGFEVMGCYNTLRALAYSGFVSMPKGHLGSATLTPKGLHLREKLTQFDLKTIIRGRMFLAPGEDYVPSA